MFAGEPQISSVALGIGSLIVGILNTMGTYFGWAKRAEGHRLSAIHYAKLYRFIAVELSLPREERMGPQEFLRYVKDQYDRLAETSPLVPPTILHKFARRFTKKYPDVAKPEEANGLEKIKVYRPAPTDPRSPMSARLGPSTSFASDLGAIGNALGPNGSNIGSNVLASPKPVADSIFMKVNPMNAGKPPGGLRISAGKDSSNDGPENYAPSAKALEDIAASGVGLPDMPADLAGPEKTSDTSAAGPGPSS